MTRSQICTVHASRTGVGIGDAPVASRNLTMGEQAAILTRSDDCYGMRHEASGMSRRI
ncbi:hypothetical protein [Caballeronia sp. LjRoot31]|jgi:hypothetical protein|uniref:hypothetical protein n=1 Tax=Caballeronia sp. LjRoot31 TaxID=3342324 RepID=UPI003ECF93AD